MTKAYTVKTASGKVVTPWCWAITKQQANTVVSTALDGTVYVQVIGTPRKIIEAEGVVLLGSLQLLLDAERTAEMLTLVNDENSLHGRITSFDQGRSIVNGRLKFTMEMTWEAVE